ncbi:MAG: lysylphosphatidylglycerol synthase domain-containing protein [Polyangia bacterium]
MRKKLGRILPWAVTVGLLFYVFRMISFREMGKAIVQAPYWTVPAFVVLVFGVYLGDCFAIWKTFGWFVARLSFREVLVVRGATYLLALVNYTVGQGAIVYFVNRSRGVPLLRGTAAVLLIMGTNILLLLIFATIGLVIAPDMPAVLRKIVFAAYGALAIYSVLLLLRPRWLTSRPIFDVLFAAGVSGHLKTVLVRVPHLGILMMFTYTSLRAFGVEVPVSHAILYLPMIYFIGVLPIAVMGLGTTQFMMILLLSRYVPGAAQDPSKAVAAITAASLGGQAVALAIQATLGVFCMRNQLARNLRQPASTA